MKIEISNNQELQRVNKRRIATLTAYLVRHMVGRGSPPNWGEIGIVLTDDRGIAEINRRHRGCAAVTDVISFRYAPHPGGDSGPEADIVVNVERAAAEGRRRAGLRRPAQWDPSMELALYIAHGCDHLAGAEDHNRAGRARMRRRELRRLRAARRAGLCRCLLRPDEKTAGLGHSDRQAP